MLPYTCTLRLDILQSMYNHAQFCPRCGNQLYWKKDEMTICTRCEHHVYENPRSTNAAILINEQDEILLVRRAVNPFKGLWDLPGGFVSIREDFEESMLREITEEIGITLERNDLRYFRTYHERYVYQEMNYFLITITYTAHIRSDITLRPADDISEARFVDPHMVDLAEIAFPSMRQTVQEYRDSLSY